MTRDRRIDVVKGVCIILMVWGHLPRVGMMADRLEAVVAWIYTFHMPIFALVTGYLFGRKTGATSEFLVVLNRMLKPYLFGAVLSMCLYGFAMRWGIETSATIKITSVYQTFFSILRGGGGGALWYLYTFGIVEVTVLVVLRLGIKSDRNTLLWITAVVVSVVIILNAFGLKVFLSDVPYFLIGFSLRVCAISLPCSFYFVLPIAVLVLLKSSLSVPFVNYVWVISILGLLIYAADLLERQMQVVAKGLAFVGRHTLTVLLFHNIFSVGIRPLSSYVLRIESSGVLLNILVCSAVIGLSILAEFLINKTILRKIVWAL